MSHRPTRWFVPFSYNAVHHVTSSCRIVVKKALFCGGHYSREYYRFSTHFLPIRRSVLSTFSCVTGTSSSSSPVPISCSFWAPFFCYLSFSSSSFSWFGCMGAASAFAFAQHQHQHQHQQEEEKKFVNPMKVNMKRWRKLPKVTKVTQSNQSDWKLPKLPEVTKVTDENVRNRTSNDTNEVWAWIRDFCKKSWCEISWF